MAKQPTRPSRRGKARRTAAGATAAPAPAASGRTGGQTGGKPLPAHCAKVALVLQGGGALGAYQAGVYATLAENGYEPDWIAGISIGAVNGAIIAGNPVERRAERLRAFWEHITEGVTGRPFLGGDLARGIFNEWSALASIAAGVPGFYRVRMPSAWLHPWGTEAALSFYDPAPLRSTLEQFVDFDLLNAGRPRLSVGAANIRKGNSVYFDTRERRLGPEHIMASAALPPGFPPVEIEGEHYWDGGYTGNPALFPLFYRTKAPDIVIVHINPLYRDELPRTSSEIVSRLNEVSFNAALLRELRNIEFVNRLIDRGVIAEGAMKRNNVHSVSDDGLMNQLGMVTKMTINRSLLLQLKEAGRAAMERFLEEKRGDIGRRSSVDLRAVVGSPGAEV